MSGRYRDHRVMLASKHATTKKEPFLRITVIPSLPVATAGYVERFEPLTSG